MAWGADTTNDYAATPTPPAGDPDAAGDGRDGLAADAIAITASQSAVAAVSESVAAWVSANDALSAASEEYRRALAAAIPSTDSDEALEAAIATRNALQRLDVPFRHVGLRDEIKEAVGRLEYRIRQLKDAGYFAAAEPTFALAALAYACRPHPQGYGATVFHDENERGEPVAVRYPCQVAHVNRLVHRPEGKRLVDFVRGNLGVDLPNENGNEIIILPSRESRKDESHPGSGVFSHYGNDAPVVTGDAILGMCLDEVRFREREAAAEAKRQEDLANLPPIEIRLAQGMEALSSRMAEFEGLVRGRLWTKEELQQMERAKAAPKRK